MIRGAWGHVAGYDQPAMYDYFRTITNNRYPKQVKLVTNRLKYGSMYWVRLDRLQDANVFGELEAGVTGNTITVTTSNVLAYTLTVDANLVNTAQAVTIITNGRVGYQGPACTITLYAQRNRNRIIGWSPRDAGGVPALEAGGAGKGR